MPYAAPRICTCGSVIPAGQRCRRCAKAVEAARPDRHARGYDADWSRLRRAHLKAHPGCVVCGATEGVDVDHKASIKDRPDRRLDPSNLQTLCRLHHNRKTHGKTS
ncbi:HNH endonuclease signature motif containing protein [Azospirillum griseum]|uniref:HNH endonuclease n=1 Tax=Azospirillum griseum TaxID=2496639 RepID=A0A3S0L1T3_9PROT|nr:HNH endonuclease signature motif containing protein [Azospirillum griseum]RTR24577.1 HNH endonuclease [Azospirillum griseum]